MLQVNVELKERRYPIRIAAGLLNEPNSYAPLKPLHHIILQRWKKP